VKDDVTYPDYLRLEELLSLQSPRSTPEHSDELLFIVVHQASELWFKAILHEMTGLVAAFKGQEIGQILWRLQRINALMRIVSSQLSSLETLPPQHFAQFRTYLGSSSGAQSTQFRDIEAASPELQTLFMQLLEKEQVKLEDLYLGPGPRMLFFIAEALLEYEQQFAQWRFKHVQLVERVIGPRTGGTGGSSGSSYLMSTVDRKFFPELWSVRAKFFGAASSK
jgi:tryptophan 2,3-dioxygenase